MGIKKIGDRVRIFVGIKHLRTKAVGNHKKRTRDSLAALDGQPIRTPSSSGSPRQATTRDRTHPTPTTNRRWSRQLDPAAIDNYHATNLNPNPRPSSPLAEPEGRGLRSHQRGGMSPIDYSRTERTGGYFSHPSSANTLTGRRPRTPSDLTTTAKVRQAQAVETTTARLPNGSPHMRVIYNSGQTKVVDVKGLRTAEELVFNVLRKLSLPEHHVKNYCFYLLDGTEANPASCRRLPDAELVRLGTDFTRPERGRLILRKIHAGEPDAEELRKAASIAFEEYYETHASAVASNLPHSKKITKLTGELWDDLKHPLSPASFQPPRGTLNDRHRNPPSAIQDLPRPDSMRAPKSKIREYHGGRPPSELISQSLTTYFPDHEREEIEKTVRMSMRRSLRLSKAANRISMASNISFTSSLKDAPPLPNIADIWLDKGQPVRGPRPLSVSRFTIPQNTFRDSIASSALQPLQEESPVEPNRKSYVSFASSSDFANVNVTDPEGKRTSLQSYFDESGSSGPTTEAGGSLNEQLSHAIADDGEGPDEELDQFLKGDSFDNVKWMQGSLIGQGSFGSVFLALHAMTGELMAVKQVEVPSNSNSEMNKRKQGMVAALKREIDLLRDLQHPNIVQYLGSNSDEEHFNIFLEYVPGGSVAAMLNQYGQLHEPLIRNFVRQILAGLSYLHGQDIIHRDIKGANVLVDNKGNIKISDFGISKRVEASALLQPGHAGGGIHRPSLQGSVFWMAPEVVKQTSYTRKADIWSLGCLIVEMFTGTHPFPNCNQLQAIFQIGGSSAKPHTPEHVSDEGKGFLKQTFEIDHEKRPSADELMLSPFMKQIA